MIFDKDEKSKITGEIYKITNIQTNKIYIGQTRSHRLNHDKYRPFGYEGRFKDHISQANSIKNTDRSYLKFAIRKYGIENFKIELVLTCKVEELDEFEKNYILQYNSKYPNGYNLTDGGIGQVDTKIKYNPSTDDILPEIKETVIYKHSEKTKELMSKRLKELFDDPKYKKGLAIKVQKQHYDKKFERFKNVCIDINNIEKYLNPCNNKIYGKHIRIKIDNVKTQFIGKYETIDEIKQRAINFIKELIQWQHDQTAGTSLESSTTTL